ncbi:KxYKxGKxW signal peptide domain-containing protein [Secundilactobacillus hailunensis]|uniref:KxYKxGKxW signal peptide domain-containing protein n=1 Tax=Secundilactobacillus hailunensis TaxID=2559923 RepID=A0ABW1T7D8_9LACO|nr:KxYKxGKxW signal peptide domain-containing protein [Secundilactobacillus hailunensis]
MVGKNNNIKTIKTNLKKHYKAYKVGKRWLYASIASFALGAGLLLGGNATAYADTTTQNDTTPVESTNVASTKSSSAASSTDTNKVSLQTANKTTDNTDTAAKSAADSNLSTTPKEAATNNGQTVKVQTSNTEVKTPNAKVQTPAPQTKVQAPKAVTAPTTNTKAVTNTPKTQTADSATKSTLATQTPTTKTLVDPTNAQLKAAQASAAQVYAATLKPQKVAAIGDPTADATLTLSKPGVGYKSGINADNPFVLTLNVTAKANDKYIINIPANTDVYQIGEVQPLPSAIGTTTQVKNTDGTHTITDTFKIDSVNTQTIKFDVNNNSYGLGHPMADAGKTVTKTITWSANGVDQKPVTFTQTITPTVSLSPVVQTYPSAEKVPQILPNKDYVFSIKVNEPNGILDDSAPSNWVNKSVNYGGTAITVPVPTDFKLNANDTKAINGFSDSQTITQPGGAGTNVIISAPAGTGLEHWQNDDLGYKLIGSFNMTQPATDTVLTAANPVNFKQVVNSDGQTLTAVGNPWTVKILGVNSGGSDIGNGETATTAEASNQNLVLSNDPADNPAYLSSFGFKVDAISDTTGAKITIKIPSGLDATSVRTPDSGITPHLYLPGTTSYNYTLTLADGSTETGTVDAGQKITPTAASAIRTIVLTPNSLAPGANTSKGRASSDVTPVSDSGMFERFIVGGQLAQTYDDGTPVKTGDQFTSTIDLAYADPTRPGKTFSASTTQTIVDGIARGEAHEAQTSTTPGVTDAGSLQLIGGNYQQTTRKIFEPIYYFVIPTATTVTGVNAAPGAKTSSFKADDGRTIVKIDYSGTGITVDTDDGAKDGQVNLANNPDALPGKYPYLIYIVSPTTKLSNTTKIADKSYAEGSADALRMELYEGDWNWDIVTSSALYDASVAKGNLDIDPVFNGTSDDKGDPTLTFYDTVLYTSLEKNAKNSNAEVAINLPTLGDGRGSQYTFNLTGPITVPANYTLANGVGDPINATVLYSTVPQTITGKETQPDESGYVPASAITDWAKVRSVIVKIPNMKANTSTGRIAFTGTTDSQLSPFKLQAGHTGSLQTTLYGNGAKASVNSKTASIKITGSSTIKARYHYVDANGQDQYIDLDDLSQTLNDNTVEFKKDDYPTMLSKFSDHDSKLIPVGYHLVLVPGTTDEVAPAIRNTDDTQPGAAQFNTWTKYNYDGDFVQYELVSDTPTKETSTPGKPGTTTSPDEPDTTVPPVTPQTPQTPDNTPTQEVTDTPVTSTSEGTVVPVTDNTPQKGQDDDTTTDSTDHGQVVPEATTSGETDETKVAQPQATVGYASATQKTAVTTKQSQTSATDQINDVKASQAKLPQTSERNNQAVTLSLLGLMTGMLSLFGLKRRKRDDD